MNASPTIPNDSNERITDLLGQGMTRHVRGQRLRRRVVAISAAAAILVGSAGFAWVTVASQAQQNRSAYCYSADDTGSRYTQVGMPDQATGPDGVTKTIADPADRVSSALDMCASAWRAGVLGSKTTPTLVACVRPDKVVAVFPKNDSDNSTDAQFCDALSLGAAK